MPTWLYTIARSFCIKQRRRSKFAPENLESLEAAGPARAVVQLEDPARRPDELVDDRRLQVALGNAIGSLEPMYREVLVLRDVEGLSANEVSEVLGLSVEAVKSRLHRARVAVREQIAPELLPEQAASEPPPACRDVVVAFSQHLEGEIDSNVCAELEQHLQGCPACRSRCDSLRATLRLCRDAAAAPVPANIEVSVREALRRYLSQQP